ncbi:MAG: hypothetical protein NVS1B14_05540 [Vulcanimicrobiaceae bacterium]
MRTVGIFAAVILSVVFATGCTSKQPTATGPAAAVRGASSGPGTAVANTSHGKQIFMQNCATCHGARGEGGVGPSLKNEREKKDLAKAQAWIKDPRPPMPKLYPGTLNDKDVLDVATYIETF